MGKINKTQPKLKIRKGDTSKSDRRRFKRTQGKVLEVLLSKNRAIVEGVNMVSKHTKPNATNPNGGIVKKEAAIQFQT